ncbi:MAG: UDP-2,3-diacylglucosamine diphosphatase LpxI [Deltaproteobacteria bacterium]|nr:UDP-2,3-diacylglucosamine diphosphatase LpxI [Deltaproteobacteria bacterium]MBN2673610.1 UDP-2,3-diacylglucosamine diphosphatase LpxI [Deltaproteobacteria bacterium]
MNADPVGLIAGSGIFPITLFERMIRAGIRVVVAGIRAHATEADYRNATYQSFAIGEIRAVSAFFRKHGVSQAYMAGGVAWRLRRAVFKPDAALLLSIPWMIRRGDDFTLRRIAALFHRNGIDISDSTPLLEDLLAPRGDIAGPRLGNEQNDELTALIARGVVQCRAFVAGDNGQAVTVHGRSWVGREDRKGTNALLQRTPGPGAVLVKMKKRHQDSRFDRPAIGPSTILVAARVGVTAIAVQAGEVLILDMEKTVKLCREHHISLVGVS